MRMTQKSTNFFKQGLCSLAIGLAIILALPANTTAQIWLDGTDVGREYENFNPVNHAGIGSVWRNAANHGDLTNWGRIVTAQVGGLIGTGATGSGKVDNRGVATIETLNAYNGTVVNWDNAHIETANLNLNGTLFNTNNATVGTVNVNGRFDRLFNSHNAYIETVNVNDGTVINGTPFTTHNAIIGTVNLYSGTVINEDNTATIETAFVHGGTIFNGGQIDELTYFDGTYNGTWWSNTGTIGTLILAADSANNTGNWGIVNNIAFHENGNGFLTIAAISDNTGRNSDIEFRSNINATNSIDLTFGNIALDLSGIAFLGDDVYSVLLNAFGASGFSLTTLLGIDESNVTGNVMSLASLQLIGFYDNPYTIFNSGSGLAEGWHFNPLTGMMTHDNIVPEPATIAVIALGLAGLGYARRRGKSAKVANGIA